MTIADYSPVAGNNVILGTISVAENSMVVSEVNDAFRQLMADLAVPEFGGAAYVADTLHARAGNDTSYTGVVGTVTRGQVSLERYDLSPSDFDVIGDLNWIGVNDAAEVTTYARIEVRCADVSDGTEDGEMFFRHVSGGIEDRWWVMRGGAFYADGEDRPGTGVINATDLQVKTYPVGWVELDAVEISTATFDWSVTGLELVAHDVMIVFDLTPVTDDVHLYLRCGDTDDVIDAGASDYSRTSRTTGVESDGSVYGANKGDAADSAIRLTDLISDVTNGNVAVTNSSSRSVSGVVYAADIDNTAIYPRFWGHTTWSPSDTAGGVSSDSGQSTWQGTRLSAMAIGTLQLRFSSGNIASGTVRCFIRPKTS